MQDAGFPHYPYFKYLEACNAFGAGGVAAWRFYPGMLFGSLEKWWPDSGSRATVHEGLDICYYTDASGTEKAFDSGVRVPVMASGRILGLCDDFLGRSVFLAHNFGEPVLLVSVYAHIRPLPEILPGCDIEAGKVIGTVADTTGRRNRMPAHLHVTIMKIPANLSDVFLDWKFICQSDMVALLDPFAIMPCPACRILPGASGRS
jgi:hypothetical protein